MSPPDSDVQKIHATSVTTSGQITIIPKAENKGGHLGWPTGGKGRYKFAQTTIFFTSSSPPSWSLAIFGPCPEEAIFAHFCGVWMQVTVEGGNGEVTILEVQDT